MASAETITVEVVYALPDEQALIPVELPAGSTIADALVAADIAARFPQIDLVTAKVGIFGKHATRERVLQTGDRVEIYRPLLADPKDRRRRRAAEGKTMRDESGEGNAG